MGKIELETSVKAHQERNEKSVYADFDSPSSPPPTQARGHRTRRPLALLYAVHFCFSECITVAECSNNVATGSNITFLELRCYSLRL